MLELPNYCRNNKEHITELEFHRLGNPFIGHVDDMDLSRLVYLLSWMGHMFFAYDRHREGYSQFCTEEKHIRKIKLIPI